MKTETTAKFKPSLVVIFEEADGYHWNFKEEVKKNGYDARGAGHKTKATAMQAARNFYNNHKSELSASAPLRD